MGVIVSPPPAFRAAIHRVAHDHSHTRRAQMLAAIGSGIIGTIIVIALIIAVVVWLLNRA
jgi:hypothetical protein